MPDSSPESSSPHLFTYQVLTSCITSLHPLMICTVWSCEFSKGERVKVALLPQSSSSLRASRIESSPWARLCNSCIFNSNRQSLNTSQTYCIRINIQVGSNYVLYMAFHRYLTPILCLVNEYTCTCIVETVE